MTAVPHTHGGTDAPECTSCPGRRGPVDWKRIERWDGLGSAITTVEVPQLDMIRVPRQLLERLLFEAGYEPDSLQTRE